MTPVACSLGLLEGHNGFLLEKENKALPGSRAECTFKSDRPRLNSNSAGYLFIYFFF